MLDAFLSHRREVVTRRTVFELREARNRGHVLEGLAVALANIDDFIAIIKAAPTPPVAKIELMNRSWDSPLVRELLERAGRDTVQGATAYRPEGLAAEFGLQGDGQYRLSAEQSEQILQMRLQRLTGLEQDKIGAEYRDVMTQIADLLDILAHAERITQIIAGELSALNKEFTDPRRSEIVRTAEDLSTSDLITPQDMVVTLSHAATSRASRWLTIARKNAAAAASRRRQREKTTGSSSCSSPTHTTRFCVSPTAAACIGSRCGRCRKARAPRAASRSSTCSRWRKTKRSRSCCRSRRSMPCITSSWQPPRHGQEDRTRRVR